MAPEQIHQTLEVYGISRDLPLNYVERKGIDDELVDSLKRDKHIVIYGSSKQGKTSLRKKNIPKDRYILVHCSNKMGIGDLNAIILKEAGFELSVSSKKTLSGKSKVSAKFKLSFLGTGGEANAETEGGYAKEITTKELELDLEDVNDIISALSSIKFDKFIIIEDFHYLKAETQKDFSVELKSLHENSKLCFIIVGVWLEKNRLIVYNGDLTGRIVSIDADKWNEVELEEVISIGEALLNIRFTDEVRNYMLKNCNDSVYILQETCYQCCIKAKIEQTQTDYTEVGVSVDDARDVIKAIVDQQSGRYVTFVSRFSSGFGTTELEMYKWILYPLLISPALELEKPMPYREIKKQILSKHPKKEDLNSGNITQALQSISALQVKLDIMPLILDYNATSRELNIVDRGFILWLENQGQEELFDMANITVD
jgi:hypothetical protein